MKNVVVTFIAAILFIPAGATAVPADRDTLFPAYEMDTVIVERTIVIRNDAGTGSFFWPGKIGLALSGGGARGIAQIGILKAFDEAGLKISRVAGTSMGSIIGGLYASGYSGADIERTLRETDFSALFSDTPRRQTLFFTQREERDRYLVSIRFDGFKPYIPRALTAGQRLTTYLSDLTIRADYYCGGDFDSLPIPFRAAATDIVSGEGVAVSHGNLADAMRASMAFPLAFTAVDWNGRMLMDGGMVNPVPVDICREMGADFVIAVNTVSTLLPEDKINDPVDIANQVTSIMSQDALDRQLGHADYVIAPALDDLEAFNFTMHDTLVNLGYQAGKEAVETIKRLLAAADDTPRLCLDRLDIADNSPLLDTLRQHFPFGEGDYFFAGALREALLYADRGMRFYRLSASISRRGDEAILLLDGEPNRPCSRIRYEFSGNTVLSDSLITSLFPCTSDQPVSLAEVIDAADSITALLHRAGYDLARIVSIEYSHVDSRLRIVIDEGRLDYVDIRGNDRTRSWIIKDNYPLRPGEPFDTRKSEKGLANIYGSGFFERVSLDIRPANSGAHLTINVKEKKFTQIRLGGHWDDEYQGEMFSEFLDDNVLGAGIQVLAHSHLSSRRYRYYLSLKADRLPRTFLTAQTRFYFSRLHRRLFTGDGAPRGFRIEDRTGWSVLFGQQIARLGTINFEYRLEDIHTRLTLDGTEDNEVFSAFAVTSTVETLNRYPYPDYGHRQDLLLEFAGQWLGGTYEEYTKLSASIEGYWPLGKYININTRLAGGISTANLPDIEKFYIGGMYSFSGYRTDQLSGDKFFVAGIRLRFKLPARIYLMANYDYGNVFDDYEQIKMQDFLNGWGAGVSIDTPLGPFDFGYGKAESRPDRLYLNVGLRF